MAGGATSAQIALCFIKGQPEEAKRGKLSSIAPQSLLEFLTGFLQ